MFKNKYLLLLLLLPLLISAQEMWINEFHYDNVSTDVGEFVEIVIEDSFVGSLVDIEMVLYNGTNGRIITQETLDAFTLGDSQGGFNIYSLNLAMQNGHDGIALVNNGQVVEFICYEGVLTATEGPAEDLTCTDIGVFETTSTLVGHSLQLSGIGNKPQLFTWLAPDTATMGMVNNGQTFMDISPKVSSVFPVNLTTGVDLTTAIDIKFTEEVIAIPASFVVTCGGNPQAISITQAAEADQYIITPVTTWQASSTCVVDLIAANIMDVEGSNNLLDGNGDGTGGDDFSFSFDITSDSLARVASTDPLNEAILVPEDFTLTLNFNEAVNLTASAVTLECPTTLGFSGLPVSGVTSVTLTPNSTVAMGSICSVTLYADQISDVDGTNDFLDGDEDGIAGGNYSFNFAVIEPIYPLYEIQGNGLASALDQVFVRTQGNVVTAIAANGFYMQTPDANADASIDTSNALFVYTGSLPTVVAGDLVDVRGLAVEFYEMTELTAVSSVDITSSGNPLPTPVIFDATVPSPDPDNPSCAIEFECYEGMLIQIDNGYVNEGSQVFAGFDAEAVVNAAGARSYRERGVERSQLQEALDSAADDGNLDYNPYIFDENPELFELDADSLLGTPHIELYAGSTFTATGVLAFNFDDYEFWPITLNVVPKEIPKVTPPFSSEITIASQNLYRFFDYIDDTQIDDADETEMTLADFNLRKAQVSNYIINKMHLPDIIVLEEVESIIVVQGIASQINLDANAFLYQALLVEGNDIGGIDIGILIKNTVSNVSLSQLGADERLDYCGSCIRLHDRPPLWINATITKGAYSQEVNVLGVHTKARSGITGSQRDRTRHKRFEQAISIANMAQNIQSDPEYIGVPLIVIGDFNAFEFDDGYADVVGEIMGGNEANANLLQSDGVTIINPMNPQLTNAVMLLPELDRYSYSFSGIPQVLDHVLLNPAADMMLSNIEYVRGNADAPFKYRFDYTQANTISDHDGIIATFELIDPQDLIFRNRFD
jgi:hypothetical protein